MGITSAQRAHNVRITGAPTGQPILFAHGFGCDQDMWRLVAPAFEDRYRVICFDYVGAGGATRPFDPQRYAELEGYAKDVLLIINELELDDVIFVGHSVSAMIGLLAAKQLPHRFAKTVMIGPSPRYIDDGEYHGGFSKEDIDDLLSDLESNFVGWSAAMTPHIMGNADRPELTEELNRSFCRMDPEVAIHFARVTFLSDNRADLTQHHTPTLVLQCSEDVIADRAVGEYISRQLPDCTIDFLSAKGHCPHLSAPEETIASIKRFLDAEPYD
ncbi:sigma-B regulation protein RsbQ [Lewinella aquimaris]|uniref:Sigma-B regulation protein RsbQ n=1 Tax=Neolewinella aquimaris TaxID=1835722 RepID=A0A840E877_9BACT|nr:alpha/beta hydrolase [Neolewinella aquimaris]MBB4079922.1 sigma-B regulation protein RsbQ [Neolewinella aquimaris]